MWCESSRGSSLVGHGESIGVLGRAFAHWHGGSASCGPSVVRHRLLPTFEFVAREGDVDLVVDDLVRSVPREHAA